MCYDDPIEIKKIFRSPRNTSGYHCVCKSGKYWMAHFYTEGERVVLVRSRDKNVAIEARRNWEIENGII